MKATVLNNDDATRSGFSQTPLAHLPRATSRANSTRPPKPNTITIWVGRLATNIVIANLDLIKPENLF